MRRLLLPLVTAAVVACGPSFGQAAPALLQPVDPMPVAAMPAELDRAPSTKSTAIQLSDEQLDTVTAGLIWGPIINFVARHPKTAQTLLLVGRLVLRGGPAPRPPVMPVRPMTPPAQTAPASRSSVSTSHACALMKAKYG
jgi:hypothetical protein